MLQRKSSISLFQMSLAVSCLLILTSAEPFETSLKSRCKSFDYYFSGSTEQGNSDNMQLDQTFLKAEMSSDESDTKRSEFVVLELSLNLMGDNLCQVFAASKERLSFYYRCPVSALHTLILTNNGNQPTEDQSVELQSAIRKYYKDNIIFKFVRVNDNESQDSGKPSNSFFLNNEISIYEAIKDIPDSNMYFGGMHFCAEVTSELELYRHDVKDPIAQKRFYILFLEEFDLTLSELLSTRQKPRTTQANHHTAPLPFYFHRRVFLALHLSQALKLVEPKLSLCSLTTSNVTLKEISKQQYQDLIQGGHFPIYIDKFYLPKIINFDISKLKDSSRKCRCFGSNPGFSGLDGIFRLQTGRGDSFSLGVLLLDMELSNLRFTSLSRLIAKYQRFLHPTQISVSQVLQKTSLGKQIDQILQDQAPNNPLSDNLSLPTAPQIEPLTQLTGSDPTINPTDLQPELCFPSGLQESQTNHRLFSKVTEFYSRITQGLQLFFTHMNSQTIQHPKSSRFTGPKFKNSFSFVRNVVFNHFVKNKPSNKLAFLDFFTDQDWKSQLLLWEEQEFRRYLMHLLGFISGEQILDISTQEAKLIDSAVSFEETVVKRTNTDFQNFLDTVYFSSSESESDRESPKIRSKSENDRHENSGQSQDPGTKSQSLGAKRPFPEGFSRKLNSKIKHILTQKPTFGKLLVC